MNYFCLTCSKEIKPYFDKRQGWNKFCSIRCKAKNMIGKKHSKEHIEKISKSLSLVSCATRFEKGFTPWNKGKKMDEEYKKRCSLCHIGKPSGRKGKKHKKESIEKMRKSKTGKKLSEECKNKISESMKGKNSLNNNPMWKGGISFIPYPLGWNYTFKEQIRYRDGYKCQLCGKPESESIRRLSIHHIDYNKNNLNINNLIALCSKCHNKTNFNREEWIELFSGDIYAAKTK